MDKEITELLVNYDKSVCDLALATRKMVLGLIPNAVETVDVKGKLIGLGFGKKYAEIVCVIMPTKVGVTLGIGYAMGLPDPAKLMEGKGKVHRHVKLKTAEDVEAPALRALLKAAVATRRKAREK